MNRINLKVIQKIINLNTLKKNLLHSIKNLHFNNGPIIKKHKKLQQIS
jgi:hypothetical protein